MEIVDNVSVLQKRKNDQLYQQWLKSRFTAIKESKFIKVTIVVLAVLMLFLDDIKMLTTGKVKCRVNFSNMTCTFQ